MRLRTFVISLLVVVLLLLAAGCGVVVLAAGSLPSGEHPDVDFRSPEISAARAAIATELEAQLDDMERRLGAEHVGSRVRIDRCEEGQDNFTRTDRHAYSCRMQIVQLMPVREGLLRNASPPQITKWFPADATAGALESAGFDPRCRQSIFEAYCDVSSPGLAAAVAAVPPDVAHVAVAIAEDEYHSIPWDCPWPARWVRDICQP